MEHGESFGPGWPALQRFIHDSCDLFEIAEANAETLARHLIQLESNAMDGDLGFRVGSAGDVNADGYDDLAISAPGSFVDGHDNAGAVHVLYGTPNGLSAAEAQLWTQESINVNDQAEENDQYGFSLATGALPAELSYLY